MITAMQRAEILRLMRKAEFDTKVVTYLHRRLGASEAMIGGRVDAWLDTLSIADGSSLIASLRGMA